MDGDRPAASQHDVTRADVDAWADAAEIELLCADGFDDAIIGIGHQFTNAFVVYDTEKVIQTLIDRDGMSEEDAHEFFEFNVVGAYVGEATPCFVRTTL